ncbi:peptide deformylase [Pseudoflavonifractor phocaeensis]|uniref:peptide deformylase n=1 Tax=Pseudoflavonifractor phocaeensis TaxID=1870988 RepID=UPI001959CD11|nr:peptide deformylase [Pseudoflavonifractor phocaeensis]MBM6869572.1 peptide deformylase [Pseudoflavonifractor phocaeensis]
MALRTILTEEDAALHKKCRAVTKFDARLGDLLDDMKETLAHANGAGLAAPQIGILRRVVVVVDGNDQMLELVNPELIWTDGEQEGFEGCLSVPGRWGVVKRPMKAKVRAQDRHGNFFEAEGEAIVARCFCHELEHLDGHLFVEHTDRLYTTEELDAMMEEGQ